MKQPIFMPSNFGGNDESGLNYMSFENSWPI